MTETKEEFLGFGGHAEAGGFELEENKIHSLEEKLSKNLDKAQDIKKEKIIIDAEISLDEVNFENYNEIIKLEPFGIGNQQPHFLLQDIEIKIFAFLVKKMLI